MSNFLSNNYFFCLKPPDILNLVDFFSYRSAPTKGSGKYLYYICTYKLLRSILNSELFFSVVDLSFYSLVALTLSFTFRLVYLTSKRLRPITLGLNPSFSANPPFRSLSFFSFRIHYMDFPDCLLFLLSISVFLLFSFLLFLHFFSCRFRAVD